MRRRKMKRPKVKDMNDLELVRWNLLQGHREAQRALRHIAYMPQPHSAEVVALAQKWNCMISVTDPSWVSSASFPDCLAVLRYLTSGRGNGKRGLN
jgi:hypothetical protein